MDFVQSLVDFGVAPEIHVDGIARIELVSENVVRATFYARHRGPDGKIENRVVVCLDWDRVVWEKIEDLHKIAREHVATAQVPTAAPH